MADTYEKLGCSKDSDNNDQSMEDNFLLTSDSDQQSSDSSKTGYFGNTERWCLDMGTDIARGT